MPKFNNLSENPRKPEVPRNLLMNSVPFFEWFKNHPYSYRVHDIAKPKNALLRSKMRRSEPLNACIVKLFDPSQENGTLQETNVSHPTIGKGKSSTHK